MTTKACGRLMAALALAAAGAVQAQDESGRRRHMVEIGWFHIDTLDDSEPLRTQLRPSLLGTLLGVDDDFVSAGTATTIGSSDTVALIYSYFFGDHWSLKFEGGVPADFDLYGDGRVQPTGLAGALAGVDLGAGEYNPLASVTQWSPGIMLQYFFGAPQRAIRPYVALGVNYTWFTDVQLDRDFEASLKEQFGALLALATGNPGQTRVEAKASSDVAPVFNAGVSIDLDDRWNLSLSASYLLLETEATIEIFAANGTQLSRSTTTIQLDPLVSTVVIGYRF